MTSHEAKLVRSERWDELRRIAERLRQAKARARKKSAPTRRALAETLKERQNRVAAIRAEVVRLAHGLCELCVRAPILHEHELHHVFSGPLRRRRESVENCILLCRTDHQLATRNDYRTLWAISRVARLSDAAKAESARRAEKAERRMSGGIP